jgi:hypothetical protein
MPDLAQIAAAWRNVLRRTAATAGRLRVSPGAVKEKPYKSVHFAREPGHRNELLFSRRTPCGPAADMFQANWRCKDFRRVLRSAREFHS